MVNLNGEYKVYIENIVIYTSKLFSKSLMAWYAYHYLFNIEFERNISNFCIFINQYIFKYHLGNIPRSLKGLYNKL